MQEVTAQLVFILLLALGGAALVSRASRLHFAQRNARIIGELYIPSTLFLLYGILALSVLFSPGLRASSEIGVEYSSWDLVLVLLIMTLFSVSYFYGFLSAAGSKRHGFNEELFLAKEHVRRFRYFGYFLIISDLVVRLGLIYSGEYFSWARGLVQGHYNLEASPLEMLQQGLGPLVAAVVVFNSRYNKKWLLYFFILAVLVLLEGHRRNLLLFMFSAGVAYLLIYRVEIGSIRFLTRLLLGGLVLAFALSVVMEMRKEFRMMPSLASESPVAFMFSATKEAVLRVVGVSESPIGSPDLAGAGLVERSMSWPTVGGSLMNRLRSGDKHLPLSDLVSDLSLSVPSALWIGEKPSFGSGSNIAQTYGLLPFHLRPDPALTSVFVMFLYAGFIGVIIFAFGVGIVSGLIYRFLVGRFHLIGAIVFVGSVSFLLVTSNQASGLVTGLRNFVLVVIIFVIFMKSPGVRWGAKT